MNRSHSIQIQLDYLQGACSELQLMWCTSAGRILQEHEIDYRIAADGVALLLSDHGQTSEDHELVVLRLFGIATDRALFLSTCDLPANGQEILHLRCRLGQGEFSRQRCHFDALPPLVGASRWNRRPGASPCLALDLETTAGELSASLKQTGWLERTVIKLAAPSLFWKYLVCGDLVDRDPEIVDLAADPAVRVVFARQDAPGPTGCVTFLSDRVLPLRLMSGPKLQLRSRHDGRVLLRRLPNASPEALGRESLEDGRQVTVAHVFVNP